MVSQPPLAFAGTATMFTFVPPLGCPGLFADTGAQVYERNKMETRYQLGAAIHICPNANAVLRSWGIYAEKAGANLMSRYVELSREGATMKDFDLTEANKRWPHPWHLVRRDAFHQELRSVALSLHGPGLPVKIFTGSPADSVFPEEGSVIFGRPARVVKADVVIGADGIQVRSSSPRSQRLADVVAVYHETLRARYQALCNGQVSIQVYDRPTLARRGRENCAAC